MVEREELLGDTCTIYWYVYVNCIKKTSYL